jgi:NTP pyrophosphatase (non-canonical NTP hydrolase)
MMTTILTEVMDEVRRAKEKFPWWPEDPVHAAAIVAEEAGELTQASLQFTYEVGTFDDMREEAIQTAAMAIRFLENMDDYQVRPSKQHDSQTLEPPTCLHERWSQGETDK